jgi:hypothetical protein
VSRRDEACHTSPPLQVDLVVGPCAIHVFLEGMLASYILLHVELLQAQICMDVVVLFS